MTIAGKYFPFNHKRPLRSRWSLLLIAGGLLTGIALYAGAPPAWAFGVNDCAATRMGSNLGCTAGDVSITGIAVAPGSPTTCVGGTTFNVDLDITVNFAIPDRWDIGIFLSQDGKDPQTLPASGGSSSCSVGILPTTSPFLDLDPNGGLDTCGDGNGAINGGTGSGVVRIYNVPVACQAINLSGGNLYIPFVVSWDNQASPSGSNCTSIADPVPNTVSKCNAPKTTVATEVQYGTVNAVVLPTIGKSDGLIAVNPGDSISYQVVIANTTGVPLSDAVLTDPAVANLTLSSASCSATTGGATCPPPATVTVAALQGSGIAIPTMPAGSSITFTVGATVANPIPAGVSSITNTATVTVGPLGPTPPANRKSNSASDTDAIIGAVYSDLSTSTKTVVDLNGGEADPGDVLRYTVTLKESSAHPAYGVSVTDHIPANVSGFTVLSIPAGATDASSAAPSGSNGTGYLNIGNITVPANGTATIVFDVAIAPGTPAGTQIGNVVTIANPGGPGGTPAAPTLTVSPSAVPVTANKILYLYGNAAAPYTMSRTPPSGSPTTAAIPSTGTNFAVWNGNNPVPLQLNNTVASATASLYLSAGDGQTRKAEARLYCSNTPAAYASSGTYDLGDVTTHVGPYNFNLTNLMGGFAFPHTCTTPNYWVLRLQNDSNAGRSFTVVPVNGGNYSRVNLNSSNVIYVGTPKFYDAAYPAGSVITQTTPGATIYIRAVVSDPFGSFDVSGATVTITNPGGTVVVNGATMTQVLDSGAATKTFEYAYSIPFATASSGNWDVRISATEGTEGTVSDYSIGAFRAVAPNLTFLKLSQVEWDPVNNSASPKAIPGAQVLYTLLISNSGEGSADSNSLKFSDPIPANTRLFVGNLGAGSPVLFSDADGDSGFTPPQPFTLSYSSKSDCNSFTYTPVPVGGYDANVCRLRVQMNGILAGATGVVVPDFGLTFRVRID